MNDQQTEGPVEAAVVLVVPKRHVKTVKSALEQFGFLDQSVKITPEPHREASKSSDSTTREQEQNADAGAAGPFPRLEFDPISGQYVDPAVLRERKEKEGLATSGQFPILKFDPVTGEYVEPSVLEERERQESESVGPPIPQGSLENAGSAGQFPALQFDSTSGQYVEPSILEERTRQQESGTVDPFPRLEFDSVSGQYVEPSVLEERKQQKEQGAKDPFPRLEFDLASGQYIEPSAIEGRQNQKDLGAMDQFPALEFDPVSGQYIDPSVAKKRKDQESGIEDERMRIPTTFPYPLNTGTASPTEVEHELKSNVLEDLALGHLFQDIALSYRRLSPNEDPTKRANNPLHRALTEGLEDLPETTLSSLELTTALLVSAFPEAYSVYKPLLLLPNNAFSSSSWTKLLSAHPTKSDLLQPVWNRIATAVGTTHVAINSPIPLHTPNEQSSSPDAQLNVLRSPTDLCPIYGDFGPSPTPQRLSSPTVADFESAFWVTTTQNGINQTWAPRYTMFSRGNIREKTRLLNLPSVTASLVVPYTAVDLYAGIGYFAFSYKKGGQQSIGNILCWELNPWSVEGLRRGAEVNGWSCRVFVNENIPNTNDEWDAFRHELESSKDADFWVFQTSNEHAEPTIRSLAKHNAPLVPPIRHVNLGLLPSSTLSWPTAVRILDTECGGWIHVHENVGAKEIVARTREIADEFQKLLDGEEGGGQGQRRRVVIEHVEKVKTYAPGVVHVVFDVRIEGEKTVDV